MTLLEYQSEDPTGRSPRSLKRRLFSSVLIGVGGGVLNLILLLVGVGSRLLAPFFIVSGPTTLALFAVQRPLRRHFHIHKEVIWVLLVLASTAQYMVYGLLLNFRFWMRRLVLLLVLLFHLASGVFLCLSGFR